jgi:homoserine dehydrogenase
LRAEHDTTFLVTAISDRVAGSLLDADGLDLEQALAGRAAGERWGGHDAAGVIGACAADVLCEATPTDVRTGEPAAGHCRAALHRGMHVVTTNKGPPALHHAELAALASEHGRSFLFEGAVMSGTPLLSTLRAGLSGTRLQSISGILNGTTNHLLTAQEAGRTFDDALGEAQRLGIAESDPSADVAGLDAAAKLTILANVVMGMNLTPADVERRPVSDVTTADIEAARAGGKRWRHLAELRDGRASVLPRLLDASHPLAGVHGAVKAVTVGTAHLGDVTIVGPGAGRVETAFAVLADLLEIHRAYG